MCWDESFWEINTLEYLSSPCHKQRIIEFWVTLPKGLLKSIKKQIFLKTPEKSNVSLIGHNIYMFASTPAMNIQQ